MADFLSGIEGANRALGHVCNLLYFLKIDENFARKTKLNMSVEQEVAKLAKQLDKIVSEENSVSI